jgi:GDP-L-fucose synthase
MSIRELAGLIRDIVAPRMSIAFDAGKPDGTPRKLLDVGRLHRLGWRHTTDLRDGLTTTYEWFRGQPVAARAPAARHSRQ